MRFVRVLAAMAALVCSTVAGQAGAVTIYRYTYTPSPNEVRPVSFSLDYAKPGIPQGKVNYFRIKCKVCPGILRSYSNPDSTSLIYETYFNGRYLHGGGIFPLIDTLAPGEYLDPKAGSKLKLETLSFVPEPATWALLILGFGATGQALRIRRRRAAPVTA